MNMAQERKTPRLNGQKENHIFVLSGPIFIELLLQMLVGNADQIMVGRVYADGVGAIGNANQITNLLLLVFSVVCTASTILISQSIGAKDPKRIGQTYAVSLLLNAVFGLLVSLILLVASPAIFRLMGVHPEIFDSTCLYMRIIAGGMLFQSLYLTFVAFFRSNQMMKETMRVSLLMNGLNILGNAILIYGWFGLPAMGIAGAAIASGVSRLIGLIIVARSFAKKFGFRQIWDNMWPMPWVQMKNLLRIGIPTGSEALSYNLSQICIQSVCNLFAAFVVNTRVYACLFANVTYLCASAMGQACQVVAARLIGAGRVEDTDRVVLKTTWTSVAISGVLSVTLYLLCEPLYGLFTDDVRIIALAKTIMLLEIPLELARAVNMAMCWGLQACGDINYPTVLCIVFAWIFGVGGSWLLGVGLDWGLVGIWAAMALDEVIRAFLIYRRWKQRKWAEKCLLVEKA